MMGQHHARVYSQLGCELVGVVDLDAGKAKEIGNRYSTRYYTDYTQLIHQVDAVSIAVPTILHQHVSIDFIKHGVHCLVEKPIAFNLAGAEKIIRAAEEKNVKLMVGHIERFNPAVLKLKEIINQGILGKLMIISTRRVGPFASRIRDVGIIIDSATHDIDIARYLLGKEAVSLFSKAGRFGHQKDDHAIIILDFGDTTVCIEVNWFTPYKTRTLVATGSKGIAYLDYIEQELKIYNSQDVREVEIEKVEPLKLELEHFLQCVQNDTEPLVSGYDGLKTLDIALKAEQAGVNV